MIVCGVERHPTAGASRITEHGGIMEITKLTVRIGDQEVDLGSCSDEEDDIRRLLALATESEASVAITVPASDEVGALLGKLYFIRGVGKLKTLGEDELVRLLSSTIDRAMPKIETRTRSCLRNANRTFVWQVAIETERNLLKTKNFGRRSLADVKHHLGEIGLELEMDLRTHADQLPGYEEWMADRDY